MPANEDEQELIAKAKSGDGVALERILLVHYARLSEHIAPKLPKSLQSVLSTDDILQQTFVQVFRDIGNFERRSETSFFAWLRTITEHRLL